MDEDSDRTEGCDLLQWQHDDLCCSIMSCLYQLNLPAAKSSSHLNYRQEYQDLCNHPFKKAIQVRITFV